MPAASNINEVNPSKETALAASKQVLDLIQKAQSLLYQAAQAASPLQGWCPQWERIGDHADATKELWKHLAYGPEPTGHDGH